MRKKTQPVLTSSSLHSQCLPHNHLLTHASTHCMCMPLRPCSSALQPTCGDVDLNTADAQRFSGCSPSTAFMYNPKAENNTIINTESCCLVSRRASNSHSYSAARSNAHPEHSRGAASSSRSTRDRAAAAGAAGADDKKGAAAASPAAGRTAAGTGQPWGRRGHKLPGWEHQP